MSHERVAEAAVSGQSDEDSGQAVPAFVTLSGDESEGDDDLVFGISELEANVSEQQNGAADSPRGSGRAGAPQRSAGVRPRR